jgi:hypothetical protein
MILFIDYPPGRCYNTGIDNACPGAHAMTTARPSFLLMSAFIATAAALVLAAISPILSVAAQVAV